MSEHSNVERGSFRLEGLGYTPEEILFLCQVVKDPNPWHKLGVIPFYGLLGAIAGQMMQKTEEQGLLSRPLVTRCVVDLYHAAKVNRIYAGEVNFTRNIVARRAAVEFSLRGQMESQLIASGQIMASYR